MKTTHSFTVSLICSLAHFAFAATQHGVIGFGIEMYKPPCCYACHDSMSSLYLSCTTFSESMDHSGMDMKLVKRMDMGGDSMATTNDTCYANNKVWLETFAYCVQNKCSSDGISTSKQSKCFASLAANGEPVPSLQDSLPLRAPTVELTEDDTWLNSTSLVNVDTYLANRLTLANFSATEESHTRYALIIILFVVGGCLLAGIWNSIEPYLSQSSAFGSISLKLNQHLFIPALVGSRHLSPLPYRAGYVPKRALSLFIFIYVALNIILSAVSYHHVSPNAWYSDRRGEIAAYVSNRTGVLSFANIALAILFSGRNSLLITITGWNQTSLIAIHRWAARVATVQAVVHSIIYTLTYIWDGGSAAYYAEAAMAYYWWGIIATVVLCLAIGFSALPIRSMSYEFFLITHIAFAILALMGCWYHIDLHFFDNWGYKVWLYIAFAFWGFDRLIRLFRLVMHNRSGSPIAVIKQIPHTDILQMSIFPQKPWSVRPGQHSFMYIPMLGKPWENHPFTIASWGAPGSLSNTFKTAAEKETDVHTTDAESTSASHASVERLDPNRIICLMRARKGMTASLQRSLANSGAASLPISILTEGLYGGERTTLLPLKTADTVLCIAGGIGITSALSFLQQYADESRQTATSSLELLRRASREYDRFILQQHQRDSSPAVEHSPAGTEEADSPHKRTAAATTSVLPTRTTSGFKPSLLQQMIRALLHMLQFAVAYFIMLLAMYYNGYIIICIFIGAYLGFFIFGWEKIELESDKNHREATMCCG